MKNLKFGRGQSILEYAMLIGIIAAGLIAMTTYISRSMNARLKQASQELDYYKKE